MSLGDAASAQFNAQGLQGYRPPPASPPPVHHILETERGPAKETACGVVLWEVVYGLPTGPAGGGEFMVHPVTASGRLESIDCMRCLRALEKKGMP